MQCAANKPLTLSYEIYAFDNSVRTAWLDGTRGFFNGTSMFLRVLGQETSPHLLELIENPALPDWQAVTGLTPLKTFKSGFGSYLATTYDELVDSPVEMGEFWSGLTHRFVVAGAPPSFDGARLLADTQIICEAEIHFWHGTRAITQPPYKTYLFMLNAVDDGYGGLEHRNSTALICTRKDLPRLDNPALTHYAVKPTEAKPRQSEGYTTLLGLISHEYFHVPTC